MFPIKLFQLKMKNIDTLKMNWEIDEWIEKNWSEKWICTCWQDQDDIELFSLQDLVFEILHILGKYMEWIAYIKVYFIKFVVLIAFEVTRSLC